MIFQSFNAGPAKQFGQELATFLLAELAAAGSSTRTREAKFSAKAEKALNKAAIRIQTFKAASPLNFYKKSQLANAFLWALKDGGCDQGYADQLTEWLTLRL